MRARSHLRGPWPHSHMKGVPHGPPQYSISHSASRPPQHRSQGELAGLPEHHCLPSRTDRSTSFLPLVLLVQGLPGACLPCGRTQEICVERMSKRRNDGAVWKEDASGSGKATISQLPNPENSLVTVCSLPFRLFGGFAYRKSNPYVSDSFLRVLPNDGSRGAVSCLKCLLKDSFLNFCFLLLRIRTSALIKRECG